jgi:tetratricopeptide (TPR) repeat protein
LLEDAVVQYRQIIKRNPHSVGLHHRLIQAHLWNDNYEEAAVTLMDLAQLHVSRGELQDALDAMQTVLSLEPHHFQARRQLVELCSGQGESRLASHHLRQLAEAALTKGSVEEAIDAFSRLMEISDDPTFQDRLAQVYESQGRTEEALHHYRQLVDRYSAAEQWEEAASATERIVTLLPEDLSVRRTLTELYQRLGLTERVLEQRFQLACHYLAQKDVDTAAELLEQVLNEHPSHNSARRVLLDVYLAQGRIEEALKQSESLTAHFILEKDHANAIELYQKLVEAQPENADLRKHLIRFYEMAQDSASAAEQWLSLAQLYCRFESWEEGVAAYTRVLELDDSRAEIHYQLARIYLEKMGDAALALQEFHRVYELDPGNTQAMSKYIRILLRLSKADSAAEVIRRLTEVNPEAADVKDSVMKDFRQRIDSEPSDLRARFVFGELCYHLGELDHAIEQFQQTRRDRSFELKSYNMLGLCFAEKTGFNMLDLAIRQFRKGLETPGFSEQDYLELRYNLAMLQYRNNRLQEALQELKDCYAVDIAYRDVREWIRRIENEIAGGPKVNRAPQK